MGELTSQGCHTNGAAAAAAAAVLCAALPVPCRLCTPDCAILCVWSPAAKAASLRGRIRQHSALHELAML